MSAIEMMDPKMDAGMLCNKAKKVLQFEPAVKVRNTVRIGPNSVQSEHTVLYVYNSEWTLWDFTNDLLIGSDKCRDLPCFATCSMK